MKNKFYFYIIVILLWGLFLEKVIYLGILESGMMAILMLCIFILSEIMHNNNNEKP